MTESFEAGGHPGPERLAALAEGCLEPQEVQALEVHLAVCPRCFRDYSDVVRTVLGPGPAEPLPVWASPTGDASRSPVATSPSNPAADAGNRRRGRFPLRTGILVGAACMGVLIAALTVQERRRSWERLLEPIRATVSEASAGGLEFPDAGAASGPTPTLRSGGHVSPALDVSFEQLQRRFEAKPDARTGYWLGAGLVAAGRLNNARLVVDGARQHAPRDSRLRNLDAILTAAEGHPAQARDLLETALREDPGDAVARRNLETLLTIQDLP